VRDSVYEYDELVIGFTYNAVLYSYLNELPIVGVVYRPPIIFETAGTRLKRDMYEEMVFLLSLSGLAPFSNMVTSIRLSENNVLNIVVGETTVIKAKFNKLTVFDEEGLQGFAPPINQEVKKYQVLDWFNVRRGMTHSHDLLRSDSNFVEYVRFYPTMRLDGHHPDKKDLVAFSTMTQEEIDVWEGSEAHARLKILKMMKEAGIRGTRNGRNPLYPERSSQEYKYYAVSIQHDYREKIPITRDKYEDTETVFHNYQTADEIFAESDDENNKYSYIDKLQRMFLENGTR